ncbi:hypothetical protein BGZ68_002592 [Mortierella alpina]|nr:hypothetical protein BGZ68_002592 [Mortierella alpina]
MSSTDYRVSTIVVLCKDCGNDVGLYPGRHKCPPRPAMPSLPSIPLQYQQPSSSSSSFAASSSRSANGSKGRMRPADLNPNSLHASGPGSYGTPSPSFSSPSSAYGSSRTPTSSSFQDRMGNGSRTPTASSFQDRMKERDREKQQREREEREAAARTIREGILDAAGSATSATTTTGGAGTTLWNRLKAAKEVINATITGEEKWPESDDSDYEGESHVTRVLREYADKKEDEEMAAKIAELDMMPTNGPGSKAAGAGSTSRNQYLRDAVRKEPATPSIISTSSNEQEDYYGKSLRARGTGQPAMQVEMTLSVD